MLENKLGQRIGIFGGTFDPIHIGHLLLAELARETLGLSFIRFIPAALAPHKLDSQPADARHRLEMVSLAISGNPYFMVDDREIRRGGPSYTVDTLGSLQDDLPDAQLFLLMGADSLAELHTWREPQRICELAHVAVLARGGHPVPDLQLLSPFLPPSRPVDQAGSLVPMPQMEMSSTQIRARVAIGSSVRYQLAPAVEAYIEAQGLYRK